MKKLVLFAVFLPCLSFAQTQTSKGMIAGRITDIYPVTDPSTKTSKCVVNFLAAYKKQYGLVTNRSCDELRRELKSRKNAVQVSRDGLTRFQADDDLLELLKDIDRESYYLKANEAALAIKPAKGMVAKVDSVEMDVTPETSNRNGAAIKPFGKSPVCILRISVQQPDKKEHKMTVFYPWSECRVDMNGQKKTLKEIYDHPEGSPPKEVSFDYTEVEYFGPGKSSADQINSLKKDPYLFVVSYDGYMPLFRN